MNEQCQKDAIQFEKENGSIALVKAGFSSLCHLLVDRHVVSERDLVAYFQKEIEQLSDDMEIQASTKFVVPNSNFLVSFLVDAKNIVKSDLDIKVSQFVDPNPHSGECEFLVVFNNISKKNIKLLEECYQRLLASHMDQLLNGR